MKPKKSRYLVWRVFAAAGMAGLLCILLLILLTADTLLHRRSPLILMVFAPLCIGLAYAAYRFCYLPYAETEKVLRLFAAGYTLQGIYQMRYSYSEAFDEVIVKTQEFLDTDKLLSASKRQAQYLALQNQINPHFLYNTLEGIRSEALIEGVDSIAEMTEALASFFRYTISKVENLVSVEEELHNIQTYFRIQQYRFGERLQLLIQCEEEDREQIYKCRLPKLTLQPIVENSIIHGIERKVGNGSLRMKLGLTQSRLLILVSDDGVGMPTEVLQRLSDNINRSSFDYMRPDTEKSGGIALINVNNRIRLLFGEEYGLTVYSTPHVGTDVEITLPAIQNDRQLEEGVQDESRTASYG